MHLWCNWRSYIKGLIHFLIPWKRRNVQSGPIFLKSWKLSQVVKKRVKLIIFAYNIKIVTVQVSPGQNIMTCPVLVIRWHFKVKWRVYLEFKKKIIDEMTMFWQIIKRKGVRVWYVTNPFYPNKGFRIAKGKVACLRRQGIFTNW